MTATRLSPTVAEFDALQGSVGQAIKVVDKQKDIATASGYYSFESGIYDTISGYTCVGIVSYQANTTYLFFSTINLNKIEVRCTSGNYTGRIYWRLLYVRNELL